MLELNRTTVICTDIDEITSKEEVCEALDKRFGFIGLQESVVTTLKKCYGGTHHPTSGGSTQVVSSMGSKNRLEYVPA